LARVSRVDKHSKEQALRDRFIEFHRGNVTFTDPQTCREQTLPAASYEHVAEFIRRHQRWKLRIGTGPELMAFNGMLDGLRAWARHAGLLRGQRKFRPREFWALRVAGIPVLVRNRAAADRCRGDNGRMLQMRLARSSDKAAVARLIGARCDWMEARGLPSWRGAADDLVAQCDNPEGDVRVLDDGVAGVIGQTVVQEAGCRSAGPMLSARSRLCTCRGRSPTRPRRHCGRGR
jgi:hypothetical protein